MSGVQFRIDVISGNSTQAVNQVVDGLEDGARAATGFSDKLKRIGEAAFVFNNISQALGSVVGEFNNAVQPGVDFNTSLTDMQAITGVTNSQLDVLGTNARHLAKDFGIDAAGAVEANKLLLSQLSPEIAKNSEALNNMTTDAAILSKQLKGDVAGATEILTTAMNQYGVSTVDPIAATKSMTDMMNIMSAAAKEGSAELPQIKAALEQSGMVAKTANVSFAELNASIQVLDKAGAKGAEGGTALRNVISKLSQGEFLPKASVEMLKAAGVDVNTLTNQSLTLSQRLIALKPIGNDTTKMLQLFGEGNAAAGIALVNNVGTIEELTGKIVGTNTATEMANITMGSFSERMARTNAWFKDLGISIFNATEGFIPFIQMGMGGLQTMTNLGGAINATSIISNTSFGKAIAKAVVGMGAMFTSMGTWIVSTITATAAQWGLNIAMDANPIGLMVIGIAAAVAAVVVMIKYWDDITGAIVAFGKWIWDHSPFAFLINAMDTIFPGFKAAMGAVWDWIKGKFDALFGWIGKAWGWVKGLLGGADTPEGVLAPAVAAAAPQAMPAVQPQSITPPAATAAKSGTGRVPKGAKESASNITSGGTRPTTINLTIHKLQDQTVINTTNLKDGAKQSADAIVQMLLEALGGVNPGMIGQ